MTTPTPPSALDAREARLRALKAGKQPPGSDGYLGKEIDLMLALDQDALPIIDHYKAEAASLRAQLAEARAERDRLVERAKRTPQFLHYPDVPEVVALRTQVAALLAEQEEVARPWELPEGTKLCSARLDAILTRKSVAGPFSAPPDPAWYDLPPYLNLTALLAAARLRAPVEVK